MTALFDYTIRMSVILSMALLGASLLRRRSAALRHVILASGIFTAALLPVFNRALPRLDWSPRVDLAALPAPVELVMRQSLASVTSQNSPSAPPPASLPVEPKPEVVAPAEPETAIVETPPRFQPSASSPSEPLPYRISLVKLVYYVGAVASLAMLLLCLVRLGRISLATTLVKDARWTQMAKEISRAYGMRRTPRLLESKSHLVLATWGVVRPRVVIPAGASDWSDDRIRVVLGHELAHVSRGDWLVQLSAEIFRAIFWFNPLVWMMGRRLRQESERACDDAVLNRGVPATEYAAHLLDLARVLGNPEPAWMPALLMARPSTLEQRFKAMLDPGLKRTVVSRQFRIVTLVAFVGIALPMAVIHATPQAIAAESYVRSTAIHTANTVRTAVLSVLQVQSPPNVPAVPNSIEGMVVRLGTSEPVSDVDIELRRVEGTASAPLGPLVMPPGYYSPGAIVRPTYPNPTDIANLRTKSDGKFVFTNLKPGVYRLQAARAGGAYYPAEYGQRSPKGRGYDFQFTQGLSMRDVRLQMAPTGSITGRVLEADGQPAARVRVMALEATYPAGERTLGIIQAVQTDDKGDYRLFWLPPGQYVVAARPEDPRRQTLQLFVTPPGSNEGKETYSQAPVALRSLENGNVVEETFEVVYYGGDRDVKRARSVDLRPGGSVSGIDLSLAGSRVRTRHVRGVLTDPSGARTPGVTVTALPHNSGPSIVAPNAIADANGAFDIAGVGTGAYTVRASLPGFAGFAVVGPGDTDVEGIAVNITLGLRLQGRFVVDGRASDSASPEVSKLSVRLENAISGLPGGSSGAVNGDAFTVNVPQAGDYRVFVSPLLIPYTSDVNRRPVIPQELQNAYVKAIRLNADDGLSGTVNVAAQPGRLEVVVSLNGGILEGSVSEAQRSAPNSVVVLVPSDRGRIDLYRVATSGGDGRFRMQGIPPGEYKAFAWDYVEDGSWFDAAFLRAHETRGKAIRISEGRNPDLPLTMERP